MSKRVLVTGASGHLGVHLVEQLLEDGYPVRAGVRDLSRALPHWQGQGVERVQCDLLKPETLTEALADVDILFQVAANFSHWSRQPGREIVQANIMMTENVLRAAHKAGVRRIVYVSSTGALQRDTSGVPVGPDSWCEDACGNPYFQSKVSSERRAWELTDELGLEMIAVLPAAMIGGRYAHRTPTTDFIEAIYQGAVPFDLGFEINLIDVEAVARGMIAAAEKGVPGQRYVLACPEGISVRDIHHLCRERNPKLGRMFSAGKGLLLAVGGISELLGKGLGIPPKLTRSQVHFYHGCKENFDLGLSQEELQFTPPTVQQTLMAHLERLTQHPTN